MSDPKQPIGIIIGAGKPAARPVPLGPKTTLMIRPITSEELDEISAEVSIMLNALEGGTDAAERVAAAIGHEYRADLMEIIAYKTSLSARLVRQKIAERCIESWTGIFSADRKPIEKPSPEAIMGLLRDPRASTIVDNAAYSQVHEENYEKRIIRLAEWWGGGGRKICAGCHKWESRCSRGGFGTETLERCPEIENAPRSAEGRAVASAIMRRAAWQYAGMSGIVIGLNLAEAMASLPDGVDREFCRALFLDAERAWLNKLYEETDGENDG